MKIIKPITKTIKEDTVDDILCNKCGLSCDNLRRKEPESRFEYDGIEEVVVTGGYYSQVIGDMTSWRFSLCELCVGELVKTFKIPHEIKDNYYAHEFVSPEEYDRLMKQEIKANRDLMITEIIKNHQQMSVEIDQKELESKSDTELHSLFYASSDKLEEYLKK